MLHVKTKQSESAAKISQALSLLKTQLELERTRANEAEKKLAVAEAEVQSLKAAVATYEADYALADEVLKTFNTTNPPVKIDLSVTHDEPKVVPAVKHPPKVVKIDQDDATICGKLNDSFDELRIGDQKVQVLKAKEATAFMQIPLGTLKSVVQLGKLPKDVAYADILEFYNENTPTGSKQKALDIKNSLSVLYTSHVEKLVGWSHSKLWDVAVVKNSIPHIRLNHTNVVFFWKDITNYIKKEGLPYSYMAIPHKFYQGLYQTAMGNQTFSRLVRLCVPALVLKDKDEHYSSDEWNFAWKSLVELEPSLSDFMKAHDTDILGPLSVLHWLRDYRTDMLEDMMTLGYIGYMAKYAVYDKDGSCV